MGQTGETSDATRAVPAALTPEQWRDLDYRQSARALDGWREQKPERRQEDDTTQYVAQMGITYDGCVTLMSRAHERVEAPPPARHALAALALYRQPYGFTHDDARALRQAADVLGPAPPGAGGPAAPETAERLRDIAARLTALLPPAGDAAERSSAR